MIGAQGTPHQNLRFLTVSFCSGRRAVPWAERAVPVRGQTEQENRDGTAVGPRVCALLTGAGAPWELASEARTVQTGGMASWGAGGAGQSGMLCPSSPPRRPLCILQNPKYILISGKLSMSQTELVLSGLLELFIWLSRLWDVNHPFPLFYS